jgi:IS5 family transposase
LSDPQFEEQLNDRLSFQHFVGLSLGNKAPDFTSFWKFKDELAKAGLTDRLFEEVNRPAQ